jgi:hypothetical protein
MATVNWIKSPTGSWHSLMDVDLTGVTGTGVYVIWHEGTPSRIVRVGQGDIVARLNEHRNNPEVTRHRDRGTLRFTWATVPLKADRDGIEKYLANHYRPLIGDAWPDVPPIPVNLPW